METTALPEDIIFIKEMEIVYAKGEKSTIRLRLSVEPNCWEQKDLIPVLDDFNRRFVNEKPKKVELAVKKETKPKPEPKPTPEKKVVRKDQFAKRWTPEQKKAIAERYKNGEGPTSIARDYNVTANTIHQICIRAGVKRGKKVEKPTNKFETPAEQEEREKRQKQALKEFREKQELPWYLKKETKHKEKD